jgi:hypothetical protein
MTATAQLAAQEIRGTVRDSTSRQPIPGAVLMLLDSTGATLGRNITNERGDYRIAAIPAMRAMRVVRIGFRPARVALPRIDGGTRQIYQVDVVMAPVPTMLEPVHVTSGANCGKRDDRLIALALLEQARAGLLATVVAREANPANMIRLRFTQFMGGTSDRIERQRVKVDSSSDVKRSFIAVRSAADFVKYGFVIEADDGRQFLGPDAETLMDDGFRDGYCFQLRGRDRNRPNQVGLAFVSSNSKRGRIDVDGTLWIDTLARALHDIQFDYRGLPTPESRVNPGGRIEFREMPNGVVLIDRWALRLPALHDDTLWDDHTPTVRTRLIAEEMGGEVATAYWPDGTKWSASLGKVRVHMVDPGLQPAVGRSIRLEETGYIGISDSLGSVTLDRLLPGPYEAVVEDSTLAQVGIPLRTSLKFTVARDEVVETTMQVPSAADQLMKMCLAATPKAIPVPAQPWFVVRLITPDGKPLGHWDWRASRGDQPGWQALDKGDGRTNAEGLLEYCGHDAPGSHGSRVLLHDPIQLEIRQSKADPWISFQFTMNHQITVVNAIIPVGEK